jgi:hypothetical protein
LERNRRGKEKITRWDQMVEKLKRQFIPVDYELDLLKNMQVLKQVVKSVKEYTEEFYRVLIRIGYFEANKEKFPCYINGLKPSIQEDLSLVRMSTIEDAYQFSLKVEENLNIKFENKQRGGSRGGKTSGWSYGGHNEDQNKDERSRPKREITHIVLMIKIMETKEEEEDMGEDLEEEAFVELFSNVEKKDIEPTSVLNIKEGK